VSDELSLKVAAWLAADPDEADRREIAALLEHDEAEAQRRFFSPLRFGTAGLRGPLEAGPSGMNRAVVRRTTQAVARWISERGDEYVARGVVVGRDARHGSETFNNEVVRVLSHLGIPVYELPAPLPTPLLAYAVRHQHAAAGVMITASHNPPRDNGYKLYDDTGAQIIPPVDTLIERYADEAPVLGELRALAEVTTLDDDIVATYIAHIVERFGGVESDLALCYTPLHGVGGETMRRLLFEAGFANVRVVAEQFTPDGSFPTLAFPNPEEPGALDLALELAARTASSLVLANDPDADRLGAAVRDEHGSWRVLKGDEIGWLLASALLSWGEMNGVVATSLVSSTLLGRVAEAHDVPFATTLTGFKWIARAGWQRESHLCFGYEEALGYAVDDAVADKDGLSAGVALARYAHELSLRGRSVLDVLDDLACTYGVHAVEQISLRASGADALARISNAVGAVRDAPPERLGSLDVTLVEDLRAGGKLPPTDGVVLQLGERGRVVLRPSGTEPKLKAYVEVTTPPCTKDQLAGQRALAAQQLASVCDDVRTLLRLG